MRRLLLIATLVALAGVGQGQQTIHVPADYATIQGALDAAVDGDTVIVGPGTYVEAVDLFGAKSLVSSYGPAVTTIHGVPGMAPGVSVTDANVSGIGPLLEGFTITGNSIIALGIAPPARIANCRIVDNDLVETAPIACGGGTGVAIMEDCVISGNSGRDGVDVFSPNCGSSEFDGRPGAIGSIADLVLINCIVTDNTGGDGGFVSIICASDSGDGGSIFQGRVTLVNCTVYGNTAGTAGGSFGYPGAVFRYSTHAPIVINSIVRDYVGPLLVFAGSGPPPGATLAFSNVEGFVGMPGGIDADPLFANPAPGVRDFHLTAGSPSIDTGQTALPNLPLEDFEGSPRIAGAALDMGAYEYTAPLPGTGEGLGLDTTVDGFGAGLGAKIGYGGSELAATLVDDLGNLGGSVPVLLGAVFPDTMPPAGLPAWDLWLDPATLAVFHDGNATPGPTIGPTPIAWGPVCLPSGLDSLTLRLQAFALTPSAANGFFAASRAVDIVFKQ